MSSDAAATPARRRRKLAAVAAGTTLAIAGAGAAYAYWSVSGSGEGEARATSASPLTITRGVTTAQLAPDRTGDLVVVVNNPNAFPVSYAGLSSVTFAKAVEPSADGSGADRPSCTAALAALESRGPFSTPRTELAAGESRSFTYPASIYMQNLPTTNQNACQGAEFVFAVTAAAAS